MVSVLLLNNNEPFSVVVVISSCGIVSIVLIVDNGINVMFVCSLQSVPV
jgi:hypothetical protein